MTYKNRNFFERVAFTLTDKEKLKSPLLVKSAFDDEQKLKQMEQEITATEEPATLKELEKLQRIIALGIHGDTAIIERLISLKNNATVNLDNDTELLLAWSKETLQSLK